MKEPRDELAALSAELRARLERERARGRSHLDAPELKAVLRARPAAAKAKRKAAAATPGPTSVKPATVKPAAPAPAAGERGKKLPLIGIEAGTPGYAKRMKELEALAKEASACDHCDLCQTRKHVVFSRGRARNRVMFIGEAPGADEDRLGEPFVGRAGKLLDQILDAVGFQRDEIYVGNILKCRPPNNRDPRPEEIAACTPYLERQIELIEPKIICSLGRFAGGFLLGQPNAKMGEIRGRIGYYRDRFMVLPIYHPAAVLRNPNLKRIVWEDVQVLRKEYLR